MDQFSCKATHRHDVSSFWPKKMEAICVHLVSTCVLNYDMFDVIDACLM